MTTADNRLFLPHEDANEWRRIESMLRRPHLTSSPTALDALITDFHAESTKQTCTFFATHAAAPDEQFDWPAFWTHGAPLMIELALELPALFDSGVVVPLLLKGEQQRRVTLSRRQCACLLAHSAFGSITSSARRVETKKWAFRAAQLFFLDAVPSALCFLNYFKLLGQRGVPAEGVLTFERLGFPRLAPPWTWEGNGTPLCAVEFDAAAPIERSPASHHADFANKFIGGGCLENDFAMEEILFVIKPELIVSMALASHMVDEDAIRIEGALQFSRYSGFGHSFRFEGDFDDERTSSPATVCAMDALQGCAKVQFGEGLVRRDLNKARVAFSGAKTVATGNWGCGAFGNDHLLKFIQQWLAASDAGAERMSYHTFGDKRCDGFAELMQRLQRCNVGELFAILLDAAREVTPGPGASARFRHAIEARSS